MCLCVLCLSVNLASTSAFDHVTVALTSAAPELDSTLINKLTDDKRSVVFEGAVRSVPCVCLCARTGSVAKSRKRLETDVWFQWDSNRK